MARYKERPEAANTPSALRHLAARTAFCPIETAFARYDAGLHEKAGGDGIEACSGDLLLESLVACAGVTFNVIATAWASASARRRPCRRRRRLPRHAGTREGRACGITEIRLRFEIDTDASDEQLATLLKLTERYCVIFQTLRTPPRLSATVERSGE